MVEEFEEVKKSQAFDAEAWFRKNQKMVLGALLVVALGLGAYLYTRDGAEDPEEIAASESLFMAEHYFGQDSLEVALKGRAGDFEGFESLAASRQGTDAGNVANLYAGLCHLNLGNFQKAIDYLQAYKGKDQVLSSMAIGCQGDAQWELGKAQEAADLYVKAARNSKNRFTAPMYLEKAALVYDLELKNTEKAIELYTEIRDNFYTSFQGSNSEKQLLRLTTAKGL
ncbi:MAG: tetratricopeptide repeat protein [Bacteroidetes bacterium]|jgi:tetratricopeptide (TPR) repeat protein|nr:tetratricopeptide repeat protein [Bacteroidota bacterium]